MPLRAQLRNDLAIIAIISSTLRLMLAGEGYGNDRGVRCGQVQAFDEVTHNRVKDALDKVEALYWRVTQEQQTRTQEVAIEEICDCPVHLRHLKSIRVFSLSDLHEQDPETIRMVLKAAEAENGEVPQYQLYCGLHFSATSPRRTTCVSIPRRPQT